MNDRSKFAAFLLCSAFAMGCSTETLESPKDDPPSTSDGGPEGSAPRTEEWIVDLHSVDVTIEASVLRAMGWWEERTSGRVKFRELLKQDELDCTYPTVRVFPDMSAVQDGGKIDQDTVGLQQRFEGTNCVLVVVSEDFKNDPDYQTIYTRTGVNPFAIIAAHELGHVLRLPHVSTTDRSIMGPLINLLPVTGPTCEDVSFLSEKRNEPIVCREPAK